MTDTTCPSLLDRTGQQALVTLMGQPALLAFDFDGTLAPLTAAPASAYPSPTVAAMLARLGQCHPIAVISGRRLDDLRPRLGFTPTLVVGNHGAERLGDRDGNIRWFQALNAARAVLASHRAILERAGLRVEDKGQSIALHFAHAHGQQREDMPLALLTSQLTAVARVFGGHQVINITPQQAPHKGNVIAEAVRETAVAGAFYVGDDLTDEDVFRAAAAHWVTVRVRPPAEGTAARFRLDAQHEVVTTIAGIARMTGTLIGA